MNDGNDDGWTHEQGAGEWAVEDGEYSRLGKWNVGLVAVSSLNFSETTDDTIIETDFYSKIDGNLTWNARVLFDYKNPNDFKYAFADIENGTWNIGYYDGSTHNISSSNDTINLNTWYRMKLVILDDTAALFVDDGNGYVKKYQLLLTTAIQSVTALSAFLH